MRDTYPKGTTDGASQPVPQERTVSKAALLTGLQRKRPICARRRIFLALRHGFDIKRPIYVSVLECAVCLMVEDDVNDLFLLFQFI